MSLVTLIVVAAQVVVAPVRAIARQSPPTIFIRGAKVVVRPGKTLDTANILIRDGKIISVGSEASAPQGAEVIDGSGLTAYPGLIHPFYRETVAGISPAGGGGGGGFGPRPNLSQAEQDAEQKKRDADPFGLETNILSKWSMKDAQDKEIAAFGSLAKNGFAVVNVSASGGILGPASAAFDTSSAKTSVGQLVSAPGFIPVSFNSRGFSSYPSSTMGAIFIARQAFFDARRYAGGDSDAAMSNLKKVTSGMTKAVFDDLTEVTFFQANKVAKEFGLNPVYGFRQDSGAVADLLKKQGATVFLKGNVPSKPSIPTDLSTASINSVRSYFNECQAGTELEKSGVTFCYEPSTTSDPLDGIRTYVRSGLSRDSALASMTTRPAELLHIGDKVGTLEAGKLANVVLVQGDLFDSSSQIMANIVAGKRVKFDMPARKTDADLKPDAALPMAKPNYELFPRPAETTKAFRLYKNATIWTEGPAGTLKNADILIRDGKIVQVGKKLEAPSGCQVVDATGFHISPGIWDCHSHTAISGSVNEGTNMVTVECRIADVIDHKSQNIYLQLSGGTVGAQQLHGSANAIGGQTSPVKWRWGLRPPDYPIAGAPLGVKFALGQNPIREDTGGFGQQQQPVGGTLLTWRPRTRMGVEESIRRALQLGREYNLAWEDFRSGKRKEEPRLDLQLEGLGEIAAGKRLIHSHGYRADELLMLMRVTKEFGAKIATLQHVLEGYKIADEMAEAGIGGSTFADWWGYKLEAYDAIPYNAALMADRGVSVSVNSDSDNHARRLNQEAAKSMRYGGVSAEKALSFVTLEPAKQMGIADHTGSLEVGKDADMVVWSAEPTSVFAVCLETYVDGVKRFDRADDAKQREARNAELKACKTLLSTSGASSGNNPFSTDLEPDTVATDGRPSKAKFGIGPITSEPATMRYARKAVLISGATVHPMDGAPFVGDVLIGANGKIASVGKGARASGAVRVDGRGKHLYPGLIDPATGIGLNEIGQVPASDDSSERGNFHPDYRVERSINPEWDTLGVARQQGVLTVLVKPTGSGISGQAALINTEGFTWEDLTIQGGVGLTFSSGGTGFNFGDSHRHDDDEDDEMTAGQRGQGGGNADPTSSLETLSNQLAAARDYAAQVMAATPDKPKARDQRQEAMLQVVEGKMPVLINVTTAASIKTAVAWAEKENVRIFLYGCTGAGEIADWLASKNIPVCLAAVYNMPRTDQPVDYYYGLPAKLAKAGVKFCLTTNNDKDVRQIRDQAGWAAAYGLDREEAARLITLRAAEVLGVSDRLGAIKPGLDGTVILTDGEIIETNTQVLRAWIEGREVPLTNRQTRLYEKYLNRPKPGKPSK